ncbi:SpoIIE family protein phosphatase [Pseudonocardia sp. RS010]|uniref:SpoIIE family protein phosphatase n=1 Tax=Pseudonocardia sp. RS010 TaxID=3385979 RepID=UPI00399F3127
MTTTVDLGPGDTLLLYTDGLPEARTGAGADRYDEDRLREFGAALPPVSAKGVVDAVEELLAGFTGIDDDIALLALGVPEAL